MAGALLGLMLKGSEAVMRSLVLNPLAAEPMTRFLTKSALAVEGQARENLTATRDTGRLQSSITSSVDTSPMPRWARVGTNLSYAKVHHEGRPKGSHPPAPEELAGWARRHGFATDRGTLYVLARKIGKKGTKGTKFLTKALKERKGRIDGYARECMVEIARRWGRI